MSRNSQTTIALIVHVEGKQPILHETLTETTEILEMELAVLSQDPSPLSRVHQMRKQAEGEDEAFADFVEKMVSQPALKAEVQENALQWFKSRMKIEAYQKAEKEASAVIAQYAFQLFVEDPAKRDFVLAGPTAQVRVRVFEVPAETHTRVA